MKLKEAIIENKQKIGIALLGLTAVGLLTYFFTKKSNKTPTSKPLNLTEKSFLTNNTSTLQQKKEEKPQQPVVEQYDQKFTRIINQVRGMLDANGNRLTPEVITAIIKGQYQLANEDMKIVIFNSRKERRQKIKDVLQFARLVAKCQFDQEQLQEKHLGAILSRFNIDKATWKDANDQWMQKAKQGQYSLSDLVQDQQTKQLLSYRHPNIKPKDFPTIEKILKFKVKTLQVLNPGELGIDLGADAAARYDIIENYINDLVFTKFHTEAEDLEYSIEQLDKSSKQQVIELQDKVNQLISNLVGEDEDQKQSDFY